MTTILLLGIAAIAGSPSIEVDGEPTRVVVRRTLGAAEVSQVGGAGPVAEAVGRRWLTFTLRSQAEADRNPPLFGTYELRDGGLVFRPKFGLVRGSRYAAAAFAGDGPHGRPIGSAEHVVPAAPPAAPTEVAGVSPHLPVLPANVLKFYVTFSAPMREGREVLERVKLVDSAGKELGAPWRDIELWNSDATRLTLFVHPGRIKQGVNLREDFGPVLLPGARYTLVVGTDLLDASGAALVREFRYQFVTSDELHRRIDVATWNVAAPPAGAKSPLVVEFDRPLDRHLALRALTVHDDAGQDLLGRSEVSADGRRWTFTPGGPWSSGGYTLRVDPVLEDLCGNSPLRAFDHDLETEKVDVLPPVLERSFLIE